IPLLLTVTTSGLSDCQLVHVAVTSRVDRLVMIPVAIICAVAPATVSAVKFAEKTTACNVDAVVDGAGVAGSEDEPHATATRPAPKTATIKRLVLRRFRCTVSVIVPLELYGVRAAVRCPRSIAAVDHRLLSGH